MKSLRVMCGWEKKQNKNLQLVSQTDAAGSDAADGDDKNMVETMFFDTLFQPRSKYLVTETQPLCSPAMISHGKMCVPCVSVCVHRSVNTGTEKQSKERADPNPFPRMNMYHARNPDPYLLTQIPNSAAPDPIPHACASPCIHKLSKSVFGCKSSST